MKTLREYIKEADERGVAIGHFNFSSLAMLYGIYNSAKKLNVPVIVGLSEGEEKFFGGEEAVALIRLWRQRDDFPIFLNADHHYSFESVKRAIDIGFDSVIIDAVNLPLEENIALTKKCVDYAKEVGAREGRDILVEAEIGFIGKSSQIIETIPEGVNENTMTKPEDAKYFVEQTGIDLLAPSVGNVHGVVKTGNPRLHGEKVKEIKDAVGIPLVLHGGSGSMNEDFKKCIENGIDIVHISTEIRVAYRHAILKGFQEYSDELAPYKYLSPSILAVEKVVEEKLKIFNNL